MSSLTVTLNADGPRDIRADSRFEARRPFDVVLHNEGQGSHVHLELDDALASVAGVSADTVFVDEGVTERVRVDTRPVEDPVEGTLSVVVGYGAESHEVDVAVEQFRADPDDVAVDESLGQPQPDPSEEESVNLETVALVGLSLFAFAVAAWSVLFTGSPLVTGGAGVVVVATAAAAAWSLR
ncbi:MAG: hypothetical protein ABEJ79_07140 [Halolamina sp.]